MINILLILALAIGVVLLYIVLPPPSRRSKMAPINAAAALIGVPISAADITAHHAARYEAIESQHTWHRAGRALSHGIELDMWACDGCPCVVPAGHLGAGLGQSD